MSQPYLHCSNSSVSADKQRGARIFKKCGSFGRALWFVEERKESGQDGVLLGITLNPEERNEM